VLIRKEIEVIPKAGARLLARAHRAVQRDEEGRVCRRLRGQVRDPGTPSPAMFQRAGLDLAGQLRHGRQGVP
jgi:hypothetical protein